MFFLSCSVKLQKRQKDIIKDDFLEEREKCSILALPKPPPGC